MCDPTGGLATLTLLSTALGVGQAVTQYQGGVAAAEANAEAANVNFANQFNILEQKRVQVDAEASEAAFDSAIVTAQEGGRIGASAADRGLGSSSVIQSLNASLFGVGRGVTMEQANAQGQRNQIAAELTGANIERQSQINRVAKPTKGSLLLGLGGAALQGANTYTGLGGKLPSPTKGK